MKRTVPVTLLVLVAHACGGGAPTELPGESPQKVTIARLSEYSQQMDGRLVSLETNLWDVVGKDKHFCPSEYTHVVVMAGTASDCICLSEEHMGRVVDAPVGSNLEVIGRVRVGGFSILNGCVDATRVSLTPPAAGASK